ncbi:MAG: PQQ-binding-like beta-propeller repeat protein [Bacillota bacterium]|jgi:outer membrane protein assembly factor BamB/predicted phosphodiesterase|nr:PQQ-binding-like beta-propeller repeat protein [Candidatus Fermentithermobacillaceae bacterium]
MLSSISGSHGTRRLKKRFTAVILALVLASMVVSLPGAALAHNSSHEDPAFLGYLSGGYGKKQFRFVVATDSHFGSWQGNKNSLLALANIAQRHPDAAFMIHMGDITETGADEEYELLKQDIAGLPFPVMATMGNHESRWQDPQGSKFRNHFGPSTYSFDYGMWHFVVLDTSYPEQTYGTLDPSVLAWLEQDLASQPASKPVALFSHHPLLYQERNFQDSDDALLEIIGKYPVHAIFSGHGHSFITWKVQGCSCFMSGALMDNAYIAVEADGLALRVYSVTPSSPNEEEAGVPGPDAPVYRESLLGAVSAPAQRGMDELVSRLSVRVEDETLKASFYLSEPASLWFQIDGGYYNELGMKKRGTHEFSVDISAHAPGTHTLRIKAVTGDGQYVTTKEFEKDTDELILWKQDLGSSLVARMLKASPSNVIVGTRNGMVYSIDAGKGDILWEYDAGAPWSGGAIDGQKLYFGTAAGEVHCLDKNTGRMTWKTTLDPAGFVEPPVICDTGKGRCLIIGSPSGKVYALSTVSGVNRWDYQASGAVTNTPSTGLGMVFFGDWAQKLYSLDVTTGQEIWVKHLGRQMYYSPAGNSLFYGNTLFAVTPADTHSGGSFLYALNPHSGEENWKGVNWRSFLEPSLPLYSQNTSVRRPFILVPDSGGRITAYYRAYGEIPWHLQGYSTLFAGLPNLDGIYVTGGARGVLAIHAGDSQLDFKVRDTFLFVDPLVLKSQGNQAKTANEYFLVQGDNRGTLWGIKIPVSP